MCHPKEQVPSSTDTRVYCTIDSRRGCHSARMVADAMTFADAPCARRCRLLIGVSYNQAFCSNSVRCDGLWHGAHSDLVAPALYLSLGVDCAPKG